MDVLLAMVSELNVIFLFLAALLVCAILHGLWVQLLSFRARLTPPSARPPSTRRAVALQLVKSDDPSVAVAAMLVVVARASDHTNGDQVGGDRLTDDKQQRIIDMLVHTVGIDLREARQRFNHGLQRATTIDRDGGNVGARLHKLKTPIERSCSLQERRDVIEMLQKIAGPGGQQTGEISDGISQLATTLLVGRH
jgi:uncharacterized tellurite resistance protein B-like protein